MLAWCLRKGCGMVQVWNKGRDRQTSEYSNLLLPLHLPLPCTLSVHLPDDIPTDVGFSERGRGRREKDLDRFAQNSVEMDE